MRYIIFLAFCACLFSCNKKKQREYKSIPNNGLTAEGYMVNDSIFDDTISFYNEPKNLVRKSVYKNGELNGLSCEYYPNGLVKVKTIYSEDHKNGLNEYFDSAGKLAYRDNYFYDLPVGPIIFYNKDGSPKRFFFANLENENLMDIQYDSLKGIKEIVANCINYTSNVQKRDSTKEISLLLYLINPPGFSFDYSILRVNKSKEEQTVENKIEDSKPFKNFTLPSLSDSSYYLIRLTVFDSILHKKSVINKEVW